MTEIEKLRFQFNIENVKNHVKAALQGHEVYCRVGSWNSQWAHCSGCGRETDWGYGDELSHDENCPYVKQQESIEILQKWVNENN